MCSTRPRCSTIGPPWLVCPGYLRAMSVHQPMSSPALSGQRQPRRADGHAEPERQQPHEPHRYADRVSGDVGGDEEERGRHRQALHHLPVRIDVRWAMRAARLTEIRRAGHLLATRTMNAMPATTRIAHMTADTIPVTNTALSIVERSIRVLIETSHFLAVFARIPPGRGEKRT